MRRANDISDAELRGFCEWFYSRFKKKETRRQWFETSIEGTFHVPTRDIKDVVRRMARLELVEVQRDFVKLLSV